MISWNGERKREKKRSVVQLSFVFFASPAQLGTANAKVMAAAVCKSTTFLTVNVPDEKKTNAGGNARGEKKTSGGRNRKKLAFSTGIRNDFRILVDVTVRPGSDSSPAGSDRTLTGVPVVGFRSYWVSLESFPAFLSRGRTWFELYLVLPSFSGSPGCFFCRQPFFWLISLGFTQFWSYICKHVSWKKIQALIWLNFTFLCWWVLKIEAITCFLSCSWVCSICSSFCVHHDLPI